MHIFGLNKKGNCRARDITGTGSDNQPNDT
jgi:hypothetical protein